MIYIVQYTVILIMIVLTCYEILYNFCRVVISTQLPFINIFATHPSCEFVDVYTCNSLQVNSMPFYSDLLY